MRPMRGGDRRGRDRLVLNAVAMHSRPLVGVAEPGFEVAQCRRPDAPTPAVRGEPGPLGDVPDGPERMLPLDAGQALARLLAHDTVVLIE